jgi:hypothetical protein
LEIFFGLVATSYNLWEATILLPLDQLLRILRPQLVLNVSSNILKLMSSDPTHTVPKLVASCEGRESVRALISYTSNPSTQNQEIESLSQDNARPVY